MTGASDKSDRATAVEPAPVSPLRDGIPSAVFNYTDEQSYNIHLKLHPDCCVDLVCGYCGASEENGRACAGQLDGLVLELFEEAACSARNANIKSIGQFTNWAVHSRHAQAFDAAARALAAQAIEARSGETEGLDPLGDSAVLDRGCAPTSPPANRGDAT